MPVNTPMGRQYVTMDSEFDEGTLRRIAETTGCGPVPAGLAELDSRPIRFTQVIDGNADAIEAAVLEFLAD